MNTSTKIEKENVIYFIVTCTYDDPITSYIAIILVFFYSKRTRFLNLNLIYFTTTYFTCTERQMAYVIIFKNRFLCDRLF